ncbi:hypothetical protein BC659_2351 [Sediminibacterium goheungense]|uniref:Uncharacterized protein n=1 Tax=Sediminibacterium goheungense TaxID=1086393 RepID=A0A4R6IYT6_9BACT|nr:hypothetical protein BC659_2351 [Sediminibacterium goheungense]
MCVKTLIILLAGILTQQRFNFFFKVMHNFFYAKSYFKSDDHDNVESKKPEQITIHQTIRMCYNG